MQRRTLIKIAGGSLLVSIAGCSGGETDTPVETDTEAETTEATATDSATSQTETETETPADVSESALTGAITELWTAFNDRDSEAFAEAYHPDNRPNEDSVEFGDVTFSVENTTIVEQSAESATVEAEMEVSADGNVVQEEEHTYDLRPADGEWYVYSYEVQIGETDDSDDGSLDVSFILEYDQAQTDASSTGVLTITHQSGDALNASDVYIEGTGITTVIGTDTDVTSSGTQWSAATGQETIVAGDSITVGVKNDHDVSLVRETSDDSTVLGTSTGPDA